MNGGIHLGLDWKRILPIVTVVILFSVNSNFLSVSSITSRPDVVQSSTNNWGGADSFFLYALNETDRIEHLTAMKAAGMKVIRIFLSAIGARSKGTSARTIPDVEPVTVGVYDDTILQAVDQLMYEVVQYGIKLDISMHDRYSLGCWAEDAYYYKYHFPSGYPGCNAQKNDVHQFYQNQTIENDFDNRLIHIITHKNNLFNNRTWGEIGEAIFTLAAENEAQSFIPSRDWDWACRRAKTLKPYIKDSRILLSTNGANVDDSLQTALFQCPLLDLMAVHNYGGGESVAANYSKIAREMAVKYNKRVYVEEFGATGDNNGTKAISLGEQIDGILSAHIPFMFWEFLKTNPRTTDYETWTDCTSWQVISNRSLTAYNDTQGAFAWPELFGSNAYLPIVGTVSSD